MDNHSTSNRTLCLNFCSYYKPGKKEDLACRGYTVVDRLMRAGKQVIFEPSRLDYDPIGNEIIVQKLCIVCDFYEDGCDFAADRNAPPCGGFLCLAQLLAGNVITIEDLAIADPQ